MSEFRTIEESKLITWLSERQQDMVELLERLVNIDSGSYDKAGVDAVGAELIKFLSDHGVSTEIIPLENHGDAIRASTGHSRQNRPIMLLGHRDTVFPKGEVKDRPFRIENGIAYGPGVADMKAGLVINAFILAGMAQLDGNWPATIGLFTGDEEIASPSSRRIIENEARSARVVFNSEPGRANGNVVSGRKGGTFYRIEISGKAAHSGSQYTSGVSAVEELARKIQALHALTDIDSGITVNVGVVSGGKSINMVAPDACCEVDTRYLNATDGAKIKQQVEEIAERSFIPETRSQINILGEFHPLTSTDDSGKLLNHYLEIAKTKGLNIAGEHSGGCADSGFTAAVGTPTICAVGPIGGKVHTADEYLEVNSIFERAEILALAIQRLPEDL